MKNFKAENNRLRRRIQCLQIEIRNLNQKIQSNKTSDDQKTSKIRDLKVEVETLKKEIAELKKKGEPEKA